MSFFTRIIRFKIYPYAKINKKFNPRKEAVREKRKLDKRLKRNACYHLSHIGNFNSTCSTAYEKFAKIFLYTLLKRYYILEALKWFLFFKNDILLDNMIFITISITEMTSQEVKLYPILALKCEYISLCRSFLCSFECISIL